MELSYYSNIKSFATFLDEAAFSPKVLHKVMRLIIRALQKKTGMAFYPFGKDGMRQFSVAGQPKTGMQYFLGNTLKSIRFNWTKKHGVEMESIDIWNGKSPKDKPTVNIDLKGKNIIQVIDVIVKQIKTPQVGEFDVAVNESVSTINSLKRILNLTDEDLSIFEARKLGDDVMQFINSAGLSVAEFQMRVKQKDQKLINQKNTFIRKLKKGGGGTTVIVTKGKIEKVIDKEGDAAVKLENELPPEVLFQDLEDLLDLVIKGIQPSILITGMAGIGKSKTVENKLKEHGKTKNKDWVLIKGTASAFGLYTALFLHRKKIVVFDDTDSIFKDEKAVNLLKAALDSNDERELSWFSKSTIDKHPDEITDEDIAQGKFPNQFVFEGQIIFISNLHQSKIDAAVRSRSFTIDITMSEENVIKRMEMLNVKVRKDLDMKFKTEVLDVIKGGGSPADKDVNMRTLLNGFKLKEGGSPRWKDLTKRYA